MIERSEEYWEGFKSKRSKDRNPYAVGQPWLSQHPQDTILRKMKDWTQGWEDHYYNVQTSTD